MKGRMFTIYPDGKITTEYFHKPPELKRLQEAVGRGPIELVPYFTTYGGLRCVAFCNEAGKRLGLLFNYPAHKQWEATVGRSIYEDHLVGPIAVLVGDEEFMEAL